MQSYSLRQSTGEEFGSQNTVEGLAGDLHIIMKAGHEEMRAHLRLPPCICHCLFIFVFSEVKLDLPHFLLSPLTSYFSCDSSIMP